MASAKQCKNPSDRFLLAVVPRKAQIFSLGDVAYRKGCFEHQFFLSLDENHLLNLLNYLYLFSVFDLKRSNVTTGKI